MVTIVEVAKRARVSTMTVSRVINRSGSVSPETYTRVMSAIKELGYIPNATARNLVTKNNRSIGLMIAAIQNSYYGRVMLGVEHVAEQHGYSVLVYNATQQEKYDEYIDNVIGRGVSGIIASHLNLGAEHVQRLNAHGIQCVLVDNEQILPHTYSICSDHYYGAAQAVEHLIALGHRRIGFIHSNIIAHDDPAPWEHTRPLGEAGNRVGHESDYSYRLWAERYKGYVDTLQAHGIAIDHELIRSGDAWFENNVNSGMVCMEELMALDQPPTAIYAGNDLFALGVLNAARKHGIRVPEDVSVIGHGGEDATKYTWPVLTSMKQPRFEIGEMAAKTLLCVLGDDVSASYPLIQSVRPAFVQGGSTAAIE